MTYKYGCKDYGKIIYIVSNYVLYILKILYLNVSKYGLQIWT